MEQYLWLVPLGVGIGALGTLIGAGGGFVLMPVRLLLYPGERPEIITSISLAVVFFNAFSGSVAYARMKRIDYRSGLLFSIATIPGAILGALTTAYIPRQLFNAVLGILMLGMSVFLFLYPNKAVAPILRATGRRLTCTLVESDGTQHSYSYNPAMGIILSLVVGYVSSLLGIGGGIIHVPALVQLLNFPVHVATATSHFILAVMALTGTVVHIATGTFSHGIRRTFALAVGVLVGAQLGARLSNRVQGQWIIRSLALGLGLAGIRIFLLAW
jgi:hypothetical protein